jgi:regulator of replication initiation timing
MQKENRYYVLKRADLDIALDKGLINSNDVDTLRRIHKSCATARDQVGKKGQDYIVVESDWPMYELVWEYISCWAEGTVNPAERQSILTRIVADIVGVKQENLPLTCQEVADLLRPKLYPDTVNSTIEIGLRIQKLLGGGDPKRIAEIPDAAFIIALAEVVDRERIKRHPSGAVTQGTAEENTQTMLSLRSQELRLQEENLQKGLRAFDNDKAVARKEIQAAYEALRSPDGYDSLGRVLREVMHQCAIGKGNERHANGKAFIDQPILAYSREYKSPVGLLFQIRKKLDEFDRLDGVARRRELLGAIVYLAALVIFDQEQRGYELMPEAKLNGVGYLA